tara:strand:+ start:16307 stop:17329 length:1023 start_codon:yes stop_codon:yes gene_type:complete
MGLDDLYSRDIAPLKNTYGLTGEEASFISGMRGREVMPEVENIIKLQGAIQRQKINDLAFERSQFEFKKEKEKAQREAEYIGKADTLFEEFDSIINESQDSFEGLQKMNSWAMRNAKQLNEHDVTKSIYNAALGRLRAKQAEKDYNLKQQDLLDKNTGQAFNIAQYGSTEAVEGIINADGEVTPYEQAALEFAKKRQEEKKLTTESATQKATREAALKDFQNEERAYNFESEELDDQIAKLKAILDEAPTREKLDSDNKPMQVAGTQEFIYEIDYGPIRPTLLREFGQEAYADPEAYLRSLIGRRKGLRQVYEKSFLKLNTNLQNQPSAGSKIRTSTQEN